MRLCRTWTFTSGHKRDATRERGAAFSSQSPKAGHWTPRAKVYIQIPGHLTSTMLNFLQYIRLCHIQISGQMQTPKVFLLLSCILHQYRTSAKAFSVQDPPQGRFKEIVLWKGANPTKLCFSVKFSREDISGRSYFNVFWTKTPVFCLIIVTCKRFVSSPDILAGKVSISPCMLQIAPPSLSTSSLGRSLISIFPQKHSLQMQPSRENLEGAFDQIVFTRLCWSIGNVLLPASLEEGQQKAIKLGQSSGCCGW